MEVSIQTPQTPLATQIGEANELKSLNPTGGVGVTRFNEAFGRVDGEPRSLQGVESVLDRVRADFEAFRVRMASPQEPTLVNQVGRGTPAQELTAAMNGALAAQMKIFEIGVAFNAGLSATQQSQSGVKTLIEKA